MKRLCYIIAPFLTVIFVLCFFGAQGMAKEKVYQMKGQITAIDTAYSTVVIEVPLEGKMFTVGGPLCPQAILQKRGQSATLEDFMLGDEVVVKWKATEEGHIIEMMKSN
jgi:hypothetical protein